MEPWEPEALRDLVDTVPFAATWQVAFTHAGTTREATVKVGWLQLRLPDTQQRLWAVVAEEYDAADQAVRTQVLLTNVAVRCEADARATDEDWRLRGWIEHGYRFDQEQGLDVEDIRVQTLAGMQRLLVLVLVAAHFVFHLIDTCRPMRSSGCASWAANWRWPWTGMGRTGSCAGWRRSGRPSPS